MIGEQKTKPNDGFRGESHLQNSGEKKSGSGIDRDDTLPRWFLEEEKKIQHFVVVNRILDQQKKIEFS